MRIRAALEIEQGLIVNTKLVKKVIRQLGIRVCQDRARGVKTLKNAPTCEDLVQLSVAMRKGGLNQSAQVTQQASLMVS